MMTKGARWAVESGYGLPRDLERCEDKGCMKQADSSHVSVKAKQRGVPQGGTLGSGNHFLELQVVREIFDPEAARAFGLAAGQVCCMIHCGSRGLGHQVCTDHLKILEQATKKYHITLPDRQLACAPILSPEGKAYFGAMAASANYAWANRQMITHTARNVLAKMFGVDYNDMPLVYDVAHNVAKSEEHHYEGKRGEVCVHRKGATRAFGPDAPDLPPDLARYRPAGHHPRQHGNIVLCSARDPYRDGKDIWQHLSRGRAGHEPVAGKKEAERKGDCSRSPERGHYCPGTQ